MFGTLHPHGCHLDDSQRQSHQQLYCGLCKTLGTEFGLLQRGMLSFDAVFMGMVADGLMQEGAAESQCRCPIMPVIHRPTVSDKSPAMRYAAAVGMLLCDQWLADRAVDGKTTARLARPLLTRSVQQAHKILDELGVSLQELDGFEDTQLACEIIGQTTPAEAAAPTAYALGVVFSQIPDLPGITEASQSSEARETLRRLGGAIGEVIYFTDALEDLKDDYLQGSFNPCLATDRAGTIEISQSRVSTTSKMLEDALAKIAQLLQLLPWQRHRPLLDNILCDQFVRAGKSAIKEAQAWTEAKAASSLQSWKQRHPLDRASARFFVAMAAMWMSILSMVSAFARTISASGPPGGKAGAVGPAFSDPASPLTPDRIQDTPGNGNTCCTQNCSDSCSSCTKDYCQCNCLSDWIKQCGDSFAKCGKSCGKSCDCTNTCSETCNKCNCNDLCNCDKHCKGCGKMCDCSKPCESCDCSKMCQCEKTCSGCGKGCECTKACESCGKSGSSGPDLPMGGCC